MCFSKLKEYVKMTAGFKPYLVVIESGKKVMIQLSYESLKHHHFKW